MKHSQVVHLLQVHLVLLSIQTFQVFLLVLFVLGIL